MGILEVIEYLKDMKLVVGLGNPGASYARNRHNVGYVLIEAFKKTGVPSGVVTASSGVYMNSSGEAVAKLVAYYKSSLDDLYVVHDDLDIPLGEYKIQKGVGPKDHKGIISVEESLKSKDFWRVRIGVDNRDPQNRIPGEDYVLMNFSAAEEKILAKVLERIIRELHDKLTQ